MFRENTLKRDLAEGKAVYGCAVMSRSPIIVEMLDIQVLIGFLSIPNMSLLGAI